MDPAFLRLYARHPVALQLYCGRDDATRRGPRSANHLFEKRHYFCNRIGRSLTTAIAILGAGGGIVFTLFIIKYYIMYYVRSHGSEGKR